MIQYAVGSQLLIKKGKKILPLLREGGIISF